MELTTFKGFMLETCGAIENEHPMFAREVRKQQELLEQKDTLIESQKAEIEKLKKEALANHPTQWAYDQACKALNNKTLALESLQKEQERLILAIKRAHLSLTWCNTDQQIPAAVWHLDQVLQKDEPNTEYEKAAEVFLQEGEKP